MNPGSACVFCGHGGPVRIFTVAHPAHPTWNAYLLCANRNVCRQRSRLAFTQLTAAR